MNLTIQIDCPSAHCVRCGDETILAPLVLRRGDLKDHVYVAGQGATRLSGFSSTDDSWQVLAAQERPEGWGNCPGGPLCSRCLAAWRELGQAFMEGTLSEALLLNRKLPPPPAMEAPAAPLPPSTQRNVTLPDQASRVDRFLSSSGASAVTPNSIPAGRPQQVTTTVHRPAPSAGVSHHPAAVPPSAVAPAQPLTQETVRKN